MAKKKKSIDLKKENWTAYFKINRREGHANYVLEADLIDPTKGLFSIDTSKLPLGDYFFKIDFIKLTPNELGTRVCSLGGRLKVVKPKKCPYKLCDGTGTREYSERGTISGEECPCSVERCHYPSHSSPERCNKKLKKGEFYYCKKHDQSTSERQALILQDVGIGDGE